MAVTEIGIISTLLVFGTPLSMWGAFPPERARQSFLTNARIFAYAVLFAIPPAVFFMYSAAEQKCVYYCLVYAASILCSLIVLAKNYYLLKGETDLFFSLDIIYYAIFITLLQSYFIGNGTILWCLPVSYAAVVAFLFFRERRKNWSSVIKGERFTPDYFYASFAALCGSFIWLLIVRLSYLIISYRFTLSEVGQYSVIAGVCEAASSLISSLMIADLGRLKRKEKRMMSVLRQQMAIVFVFALFFTLCGPFILSKLYGVQSEILRALTYPLVTAAVLFVAFRALQNQFLLAGKTWEYLASNFVVLASYAGLAWLYKDLSLTSIAWFYAAAAFAGLAYASFRNLKLARMA